MYKAKRLQKGIFGIFDSNDRQIGEFKRPFDRYGEETFTPFRRGDCWYALYSPSYVALSVLELPSCNYVGGEDQKNTFGFCPMEVLIPSFQYFQYEDGDWSKEYDPTGWEKEDEVFFEDFAFVAGCIWGGQPEIRLIDIREAHAGIIKPIPGLIFDKPNDISLKDCIELYGNDSKTKEGCATTVNLAVRKTLGLRPDLSFTA
jgi:hypothetical protein